MDLIICKGTFRILPARFTFIRHISVHNSIRLFLTLSTSRDVSNCNPLNRSTYRMSESILQLNTDSPFRFLWFGSAPWSKRHSITARGCLFFTADIKGELKYLSQWSRTCHDAHANILSTTLIYKSC